MYRKAVQHCGLQGVYTLNDNQRNVDVPIVFYCKATSEAEANRIHQLVWNQDVTPFILVETPKMIRLYCGFRFSSQAGDDRARGLLEAAIAFNEAAERLSALSAEAIDCGRVWDVWGSEVTTKTRVDWTLLKNLEDLERELRRQGLDRQASHALIGKFVYLQYLRQRGILSDRKLERWGLGSADIFSRQADLAAFRELNRRLDEWLNGAVFPLNPEAIKPSHLQLVAGVFQGDTTAGQLHLDFEPYDFSFIPIETLSVIYEQFLHSPDQGESNRGKKAGAYYTPLPLVNYVLNELETRRPLREGMRVLDPSCGSGAFLVQCYRALIEKRLARGGRLPTPGELSELLTGHIFGVDRDGDACQVAELSLVLTLLDYITPPDLENTQLFKLPVLRNRNIFKADFFDSASPWEEASRGLRFDWLVGNPPWREFSRGDDEDRHMRQWADGNRKTNPIGGNQAAEAFVWKALPFIAKEGIAGLVLPAMTLFKIESEQFRRKLFSCVHPWRLANFSNLRFTLFSGRSKHPAMSLFFSIEDKNGALTQINTFILSFAPFAVNQRANRQGKKREKDTWNLIITSSELAEVSQSEAAAGCAETWKLAMWGTYRDKRILQRASNRFPQLTDFLKAHGLTPPHEGFQLRDPGKSKEPVEYIPELRDKKKIDFSKLRDCGRIFAFPKRVITPISPNETYVRKGRGALPMSVSRPPHIIVDAARRFAVYSDHFVAVPPRQIGLAGSGRDKDILKALTVYLSSDFVTYQQFFISPEWGIRTARSTLSALKCLQTPLDELSQADIQEWAGLCDELINEGDGGKTVSPRLITELNERVMKLLGFTISEQFLIYDFVRWNMRMIDGMTPNELLGSPSRNTLSDYLGILKNELDAFLGDQTGFHHRVEAMHDKISVIIAISLTTDSQDAPRIYHADEEAAASLRTTREKLLKQHSQWLYFSRNLRVYANNALYMLKPMERLHWTNRQAILDAGEVIAETLGQPEA
ncbi:MAG: N-6 DNA methylase [Pseudomonadota bacterium]